MTVNEKTAEEVFGDEVDQHGTDEDQVFIHPQRGQPGSPPGGQRGETGDLEDACG